uniref:Uncharacterized protein n=1 Tax=Scophthalmus maximus TaxID=52904 RepID=A0A8D3CE66_SCOMX
MHKLKPNICTRVLFVQNPVESARRTLMNGGYHFFFFSKQNNARRLCEEDHLSLYRHYMFYVWVPVQHNPRMVEMCVCVYGCCNSACR